MEKIIITGSRGFLGARLLKNYNNNFDYEVMGFSHKNLDITDKKCVSEVINGYKPDYLIHCAAISDTGYAQMHPEETYEINVKATANLAKVCEKNGTKLIYMSSDQVYNGCTQLGNLSEEALLCPETVYAIQKLEMEQKVQNIAPDAVGLRLTWMYDLPNRYLKTNSNLIGNILQAAKNNAEIRFPIREYRGITYVWELIDKMDKILRLPGGIYNCGSTNDKNTYDTALYAAQALGIQNGKAFILEDTEKYQDHIRNLAIDVGKIEDYSIYIPNTQKGIEVFINEYGL